MSEEYLKVIKNLKLSFTVIGRNEERAKALAEKYEGEGLGNGVKAIESLNSKDYSLVIIASAIESLKNLTIACLKKGFEKILIEKPGALNTKELKEIKEEKVDQKIWIAYNRRYFASSLKLRELIKDDEIQGCFFDFTERDKDIVNANKSPAVEKTWGFANSSHVIDLAFSFIGLPTNIETKISGSMDRHPTGSSFVGSGKTEKTLFSYFATWQGGGRWSVEISTDKGRYKMSPLEELSFCQRNQFAWKQISINTEDEVDFKPGLKKMVESVLDEKDILLSTLSQQIEFSKTINKIFSYEE